MKYLYNILKEKKVNNPKIVKILNYMMKDTKYKDILNQ